MQVIKTERRHDVAASAVVLDNERIIDRHFTATVDADELGVQIELVVATFNEAGKPPSPQCIGVHVQGVDTSSPISAEVLRKIPVSRLLREAVAKHARAIIVQADGTVRVGGSAPPPSRRPRSGSRITTEELLLVRDLYRKALREGQPPTRTVADELGVPRPTAARWVAKTRDAGLLGPAKRGKASG